ncbi:hypothetical protein [Kaarinaea lacus]
MFKDIYPNLDQWLRYGGSLNMYSVSDGIVKIEIGDTEGLADEHAYECETIEDGLILAEQKAEELIAEARDLMSMYESGDVKSVDQEIIHITGVPPMRNPLFETDTTEESAE